VYVIVYLINKISKKGNPNGNLLVGPGTPRGRNADTFLLILVVTTYTSSLYILSCRGEALELLMLKDN
jgi:hypothetical protein